MGAQGQEGRGDLLWCLSAAAPAQLEVPQAGVRLEGLGQGGGVEGADPQCEGLQDIRCSRTVRCCTPQQAQHRHRRKWRWRWHNGTMSQKM